MAKAKTKKILWGFLVLILIAGGIEAYSFWNQSGETEKKLDIVSVTKGNLEDIVSAQGKLEPKDYVDVGAQVSGQLQKLYVDIGSVVKEGDLLAELDPQVYQNVLKGDQAKLASLQAQLDQQKAQTVYSKLQYERAAKLIKSKAISQDEMDDKETALKVAEATIKSLEAQIAEEQASIDKDQVNLGYTKIYAPMSGIVSNRTAREGQTLNANQTTPTIVQVANLNVMTIRAQVAEADVMRLKSGMEASFTTMGDQEMKWKGTIRQILPTPEVVNDVVLYNALIDVENPDGLLMNGMSTQVSFVVSHADNAVLLPMRALGYHLVDQDSEKGKVYRVSVMTSRGAQDREVLVGLMTRSSVQILDGLAEGDQVVVTGNSGKLEKASQTGKMMGPPGMGARL